MLTRVTITGADDRTDPNELVLLSREFPFVEWGILHSAKRLGTPRYPAMRWMDSFSAAIEGKNVSVSLHLCGERSRLAMTGQTLVMPIKAKRIQLNGWRPGADTEALRYWSVCHEVEFILQVGSEDQLADAAREAEEIGQASLLFDPSGGRGIAAFRYPRAPIGVRLGYAGGLGPNNVLDEIELIGPVLHRYWIDMESGVRTNDDVLDLMEVRCVLRSVARCAWSPG